MKTTYDKKADAFYIKFSRGAKKMVHTVKLKNFLFVDIGKKEEVYGIEILNASAHLPSKKRSV